MDPKHDQTTNEAPPMRNKSSKPNGQPEPNAEMKIRKPEEDVLNVIESVESQLGALRKAHEEHRRAMQSLNEQRSSLQQQGEELEQREQELMNREVELAEMRQQFEQREMDIVQRASGLEQHESKLAAQAESLEQHEAELESRASEIQRKISELDDQLRGIAERKSVLKKLEQEVKQKLAREDEAVSSTSTWYESACTGWTRGGTVLCSGASATLTNGFNDAGAIWTDPLYFGYSRAVLRASVRFRDLGGNPGNGFGMLITNESPPATVGTNTTLGLPPHNGVFLTWRFNGSSSDTIAVGRMNASGPIYFSNAASHTVNSSSPIYTYSIDSTNESQYLTIELTYEADTLTGSRGRASVTIITSTGTRIPIPALDTDLGVGADIILASEPVRGVIAASTSSTQDIEVIAYEQTVGFFTNPPSGFEVENTCPTVAP